MGTTSQGAQEIAAAEYNKRQDEARRVREGRENKERLLRETQEAAKRLSNQTNFVVSRNGFVSPVPNGAHGPQPTLSSGMIYRGGSGGHGFHQSTNTMRVMDANGNQSSRTIYENARGQIINPFTGKTDQQRGHYNHGKK